MPARRNWLTAVLIAGLFTGILDGLAAIIQYSMKGGKTPDVVFKFIASGVFGKAAFSGGTPMVISGILFHFLISLIFASVFFLLYPRIQWWRQYKIAAGIFYGLLVWSVMNLLVIPLSNTPSIIFRPEKALVAAGILVLCFGLPLSFLANKYYLYKK